MQSLNRRMGEAKRAHRIDGHGLRPLPILVCPAWAKTSYLRGGSRE